MQVETTKKRFPVGEYHRLAKAGILKPGDRTELIDGEIIQMSPIGAHHMSVVNRMNALFAVAFDKKATVQV
jgi:Uma2 family endonuclease